MQIVTRRQFAKYAISFGAFAGSTMLLGGCQKKLEDKPLAIDFLGPMAFTQQADVYEIRMPFLDDNASPKLHSDCVPIPEQPNKNCHQAGIQTSVSGVTLKYGSYFLRGPESSTSNEPPYLTDHGKIYSPRCKIDPTKEPYIFLTVPKPRLIVALDPVPCTIYDEKEIYKGKYAVGLRFLYDKTGKPELGRKCPNGNCDVGTIRLEPAPDDTEVNFSILYAPFDTNDSDHSDAKRSFNLLSDLYDLNLTVSFDDHKKQPDLEIPDPIHVLQQLDNVGPIQDCKAPICLG